jgi:hypothetical protein
VKGGYRLVFLYREYAECQTRPVCGVCERVNELSWAAAAAAARSRPLSRARSRAVSSCQVGRAAELTGTAESPLRPTETMLYTLLVALIGSASATSLLSLRGGVRRDSSRPECRTRIKQQATTNRPHLFT